MTRGKPQNRIPIDAPAVRRRLKQMGLSASDASRQAWLSSGYLYTAFHRGYVTRDTLPALQEVLGDGGGTWLKRDNNVVDRSHQRPVSREGKMGSVSFTGSQHPTREGEI